MIEADLRTFLLEQATVTALVGQRVYGLVREQGLAEQLPAVLLQRILTTRFPTFCATEKLVSCDMQVDAYGIGGEEAWTLADVLRKVLIDFSGMMGATQVSKALLTNEFPLTDPDPGVIRVTQLYNFWYVED
jgi:hypothetical protein